MLSAYRDRIAGLKSSYTMYKKMARTLGLVRKDAVIEVKMPGKRRNKKGQVKVEKTRQSISVPTWPEFVQYLLMTPTSSDVR